MRIQKLSSGQVLVFTQLTRYVVEEENDEEINISAPGLDETFSTVDFPEDSPIEALAAFFITRLELNA